MKLATIASAAVLAACAGSAANAAIDLHNSPILTSGQARLSAMPEAMDFGTRDTGVIYDSQVAGSAGGTSVTGNAGLTNSVLSSYASIGVDTNYMTAFKFVGGVAVANQVLYFGFYDATGATLLSSFGVQLPQAGNFIWTITLNNAIPIDNTGKVALIPDNGVVGTFRYAATAPAIGTSTDVADSKPGYYRYQITVPAPASAGLLGLAGVVAMRRRRA